MTTWRIAWRNLWRNRRRTGLAVSAIGLSVALVLAYNSMLRAYGDWMLETITGPMLGHVQIHAPLWRSTQAVDRTIPDVDRLLAALARDPDVTGATPRVYAPALAAPREEGFAVIVIGVELANETAANRLLSNAPPALAPHQVLVGDLLADQMHVAAGDEIAIVGQAADGSIANDLYIVAGRVKTSVDMVNRQGIVMTLGDAQALLAMPNEAHEIVVFTRDATTAPSFAARLARLPDLAGLEVLDWKALAPEMVSLVGLVEAAWIFVLVLVFAAAAAGVANTMLMATFERTREFGMLLALGTAPARIVRLVGLEAVALGLVGALAGAAIGGALVAWLHRTGVDYSALTGGGPSEISAFGVTFSLVFYPTLQAIDFVRVVGAVVLTSLVASAWPALRIARLQPARALRD